MGTAMKADSSRFRLRTADLGILLVCAVGAFMTFQYHGEVEVQQAWDIPSRDHDKDSHIEEWQRLPRPLIADVDGDGANEVVLVTSEPKIKIFKMKGDVVDESPFA